MNVTEKLLEHLYASFPDVEPPAGDLLISHICHDCLKLRDDFKGKKWREIGCEIIEQHATDLPLFTPEAFSCYLPAYLRHVLEINDPFLTTAEFVVYSLLNTGGRNVDLRQRSRMGAFTQQQLVFLKEFLRYVQKDTHSSFLQGDIVCSLEEVEQYIQVSE